MSDVLTFPTKRKRAYRSGPRPAELPANVVRLHPPPEPALRRTPELAFLTALTWALIERDPSGLNTLGVPIMCKLERLAEREADPTAIREVQRLVVGIMNTVDRQAKDREGQL